MWNAESAQHNNARLERLLANWDAQDQRCQPRPTTGRESIIARAKAYIAREPPAISGQGGHNTAFHVASILVKGFGLTEEEAFDASQAWNLTCQPPWSERELRHKLRDAARAPGEVGTLLNGEANGHTNGTPAARPPATPRVITAADVATVDDLIAAGSEISWLWPGWIQVGVLTAVAALGGTGKTRFCADLIRRIRHSLAWPDGQKISLPSNSLAMWVVADNHHDEMVSLCQAFGIADAVRFNAFRAEPYGGVSLETKEDLADFEARIQAVLPALVMIDTVGNATDRNLSVQEDAKAFYQPLQVIARRCRTAILCLTHLNAGGTVLGRRAIEKVRVAIRMEQPDPVSESRRLSVIKTNAKRPQPLEVTMGNAGNEYSESAADSGRTESIPPKVQEACDWLRKWLAAQPRRVRETRHNAEQAGFSAKTLYRAKDVANIQEFESEGYKWWRLTNDTEEF